MAWKDRGVIGLLVLVLAALSIGIMLPPPPDPPPASPAPVAVRPYREGVLGHPSSINPLTVRTQVDRDLVGLLFRGLVHLGPEGTLLPDLAQSWSVSADGKSYRFVMRPDAYWHDGQRVTTRDVAFTVGILQSADYDGPFGATWRGVRVVTETDRVVRFELPIARAGFLQSATLALLPEHVLEGTAVDELATGPFSRQPLGDGPFRLVELDSKHAVLDRVRYVEPAQTAFGAPAATQSAVVPGLPVQYDTLSTIELRFFDAPAAMITELQAGRLEAVGGLAGGNLRTALKTPGVRLIRYPGTSLTAVVLNQLPTHPEFHAAVVRTGLLAAIDRDGIIATQLGGFATRADIPYPPSSPAFDATAVTVTMYDTAAAVASLEKGGWTNRSDGWRPAKATAPIAINLLAPDEASNATANATARKVALDWQSIGIAVELRSLPASEYVAALKGRAFDAAIVTVELGLDPDLTPLLASSETVAGGSNVSGFQSTSLDKLLVAAASKVDPAGHKTAQADLEKYLSANKPILPLYFGDYPFVVSESIENVSPREVGDGSGRYWDVIDWRLASDR